MRKKIYNQKLDKEKIDSIVEILGNHIVRRSVVLGVDYPDGTGTYGITDPGEIDITESRVGGSVYRGEVIETLCGNEEIRYIISIRESLYDYIWAEITRKDDGAVEVYETYEEVVQAAKDLAVGKRPFNFVRCYMRRDICCYCRYWNGNRKIDSNKRLWVDPDTKFECTFQNVTDDNRVHLPDDEACKYYELLDLEEAWKETIKKDYEE